MKDNVRVVQTRALGPRAKQIILVLKKGRE
jgi:hypothetical protein